VFSRVVVVPGTVGILYDCRRIVDGIDAAGCLVTKVICKPIEVAHILDRLNTVDSLRPDHDFVHRGTRTGLLYEVDRLTEPVIVSEVAYGV
jgi:hypothetical protein